MGIFYITGISHVLFKIKFGFWPWTKSYLYYSEPQTSVNETLSMYAEVVNYFLSQQERLHTRQEWDSRLSTVVIDKKVQKAEKQFQRACKLAKRFGFEVGDSYRDYLS